MYSSLDACLRDWAERRPGQVLFSRPEKTTYAEANAHVDSLAHRLKLKISNQPVLLNVGHGARCVLHLLACLRAEVPVVLAPPALTPTETDRLAAISGAALRIDGEQWLPLQPGASLMQTEAWRESRAALAFTSSGSTGAPRLVLRSNESLVGEGERYRVVCNVSLADTIMPGAPLCHAFSLGAAVAAALVAGATLRVPETIAPRALQEVLEKEEVTILATVPPIASALAAVDAGRKIRSKLRTVIVGAGRVMPRMAADFERKWGLAPCQNYGSSETGALLFAFPPESTFCTGVPMHGIQCSLVSEGDAPGQLWIKEKHMPLGYLGERGFETARFAPGRWWPTGDLCVQNVNSAYTIVGRLGDLIRRGGHSIQPREIENALLLHHPQIEDVVVKGAGNPGGGEQLIEAHVQPRAGATVSVQDLRNCLAGQIADFKVPHVWKIGPIPRTWSFKADRNGLHGAALAAPPSAAAMLMGYRKSEALLAAEQVGLLDFLNAQPKSTEVLAPRLGVDGAALQLFLKVLAQTGVVESTTEGWVLKAELGASWKELCSLERELSRTWLRAGAIADVLRMGVKARPFDHTESPESFVQAYRNALCGPWQLVAARQLLHLLPRTDKRPLRVLEIGRGIGRISCFLAEHANADYSLICLPPGPPVVWENEILTLRRIPVVRSWEDIEFDSSSFDAILITNAIHWLAAENAREILLRLTSGLSPQGILAILDIFLPERESHIQDSAVVPLFLLDWMTHGGTHWLTTSELAGAMEQLSLENRQVTTLPALNWTLITGRMAVSPAMQELRLEGAYS